MGEQFCCRNPSIVYPSAKRRAGRRQRRAIRGLLNGARVAYWRADRPSEELAMKLTLALTLSVMLAACSAPRAATAPLPTLAEELLGTRWQLSEIEGSAVAPGVQADIGFVAPGRVAGATGCNRFIGPLEMNGSHIHVGPLATSRRACQRHLAQFETTYLKALHASTRLHATDTTLTLRAANSLALLRFRRIQDTTPRR